MNYQEIQTIFKTTANRIFKRQYRYFVLDRTRISEFEARHVMTKVLEELKYHYGIELRTIEKHKAHVGLVDLVVFDKGKKGRQLGWVEFKRGAAPEEKIQKDFEKMLKEPDLNFASFFHILPMPEYKSKRGDRNTRDVVLRRYNKSHEAALNTLKRTNQSPISKEFVFFLLDCKKGQYLVKHLKDIREELDFAEIKWKKLAYGREEPSIRWEDNRVDENQKHIKLFYGDAEKEGWNEFRLVALLSPPRGNTFCVHFVIEDKDEKHKEMRKAVIRELDYYLIDLQKESPWEYAKYHCTTGANMYSMVHWTYYQKGNSGKALRSELIPAPSG
jgi:hypothetical protein